MSIIGSNVLAGASGGAVEAYEIEQSLRFDDNGSTYLNRTPSSAGNQKTWTFSAWLKRGSFTANQGIFNPVYGGDGSNESQIRWKSDNTLQIYDAGGTSFNFVTTQVFRDPSAWYHLVVAVDTTQATEANRFKLYINGEQVTAFGTSTYPAQNYTTGWNGTSRHDIGRYAQGGNLYYGGYMAEVHQIDGTQLDPDSFGESDDNGVWRPIEYTGGSYGTNGFYMKFDETASNGIGHDHSGTGNNFTASGFTTSGTGTDVFSDTPTKNFCTWNPLDNAGVTISNGNLDTSSGSSGVCTGTFAVSSGKHYWEYSNMTTGTGTPFIMGLCQEAGQSPSGHSNHKRAALFYTDGSGNGNVWRYENGSVATTITVPSSIRRFYPQDVLNIAFDADSGKVWFGKNGSYLDSSGGFTGNPSTGANATITFPDTDIAMTPVRDHAGVAISATANFGQREFSRTPGTIGATDYFNTVTYTANNQSSLSVTGVGFQPDLVWLKTRSRDEHHYIYDAVRGAGDRISPSQTIAETTGDNTFTSFDSDGFTLGADGAGIANYQTDSMVAWCWKASGSGSANNAGEINATVSANQDAGFSIATFTGATYTGVYADDAKTVAHGLGSAPDFYIVKSLAASGWFCYHSALGNGKYIELDQTAGATTNARIWENTSPTNTVFTMGSFWPSNIVDGEDMVAYLWTEKAGVSKFGSYDGNGSSTEGPVISCGFRPAMVMIKWYEGANTAESWQLYDNKRGGNPNNTVLAPDANADDESPSDRYIQFNEDGFQLKSNGQQINRSGAKYIFAAWAATFTDGDFKSLNTANFPAPEIKDGSKYFDTKLFTAGTTTVTGIGHQPDFVWVKNRDQSYNHRLFDVVRGVKNQLYSNFDEPEATNESDALLTFTSDGFTHGKFGSADADDFVGWNWKAGGSGSSNTNGTITSTVSASPTSGFSIVGWTGDGSSSATVGHGLGVTPDMIWTKARAGTSAANSWYCWHKNLSSGYNIRLDKTNNQLNTSSASAGVVAAPTNTTTFGFTAGSNVDNVNEDDTTFIAYCFAEVEGYSKFGFYSASGQTFVYTGFAPALVIIKALESANWVIFDRKRSPYNKADEQLMPNSSGQEVTNDGDLDFLSNGFKLLSGAATTNAYTYIYAAFAENPFGGEGVSPATAR